MHLVAGEHGRRAQCVLEEPHDRSAPFKLPGTAAVACRRVVGEQLDAVACEDRRLTRFFELVTLEWGLMIASAVLLIGLALLLAAVNQWQSAGFGDLDYARTMRLVIPGVTLTALGFQTVLSSFFASILGMRRK